MKRTLAIILAILIAAATLFAFSSCGETTKVDISNAKSLADLKGAKIAAQSGTFHADALEQIEGAKTSTYPEFADLLIALKSGAIDGYIAEEPTAIAITLEDNTLDYLHFTNNETGFQATDADVAIAVGVAKNSSLADKINTALATISNETRLALMANMVSISAGETVTKLALNIPEVSGEPVGTLKVAMECAYEPFNWTDLETASLGAVPIYDETGAVKAGQYANGYDVQIAAYVAAYLNMKLEVYAIDWESLIPAVQAGTVDAIVAGMSPTEERSQQITFSDVYYTSNLVVIYKK